MHITHFFLGVFLSLVSYLCVLCSVSQSVADEFFIECMTRNAEFSRRNVITWRQMTRNILNFYHFHTTTTFQFYFALCEYYILYTTNFRCTNTIWINICEVIIRLFPRCLCVYFKNGSLSNEDFTVIHKPQFVIKKFKCGRRRQKLKVLDRVNATTDIQIKPIMI